MQRNISVTARNNLARLSRPRQWPLKGYAFECPDGPQVQHSSPFPKTTGHVRGFSLIEMLVVVFVLMVGAGITFISIIPAIRNIRVTNAYETTLSAIDTARSRATAMRRVYAVNFILPRTVTITDATDPAAPAILNVSLPDDISFDAEAGIPATNATAPDRLGNGQPDGPICFDIGVTLNCETTVLFFPDGSARDAAGNIDNGVVYLARPQDLMSSRAITLFGLTGRARGWRLSLDASAGTTYWRQQ